MNYITKWGNEWIISQSKRMNSEWTKSLNEWMNECSGAATVRLEMPIDMQSALIFHYNLKFYNKDTDNFEGTSLKRFVMQVRHLLDSLFINWFWILKITIFQNLAEFKKTKCLKSTILKTFLFLHNAKFWPWKKIWAKGP